MPMPCSKYNKVPQPHFKHIRNLEKKNKFAKIDFKNFVAQKYE